MFDGEYVFTGGWGKLFHNLPNVRRTFRLVTFSPKGIRRDGKRKWNKSRKKKERSFREVVKRVRKIRDKKDSCRVDPKRQIAKKRRVEKEI